MFREVFGAEILKKNEQDYFSNAPASGVGRAFTHGWGALIAIFSSPLVACGPADRRGVGIRGVSGVRHNSYILYIYLSI